jgi:DNA-binding NarL/FixJ family response regulator
LVAKSSETRLVVVTGASDANVLANAPRCNPDGMVHQSELLELLLGALRVVSAGGRLFSPKLNHFRIRAGPNSFGL